MKTSRNDPCPCGSGKKYKYCCISLSGAVNSELENLLLDQEFGSMEEVQSAAYTIVTKQNHKPQDHFLGLSSEQVHQMLYFAFDTPESFHFNNQLSIEPDAPILLLIKGIISGIDDKGLKATAATGSLPQKLCRKIWSDYIKSYKDDSCHPLHRVNNEGDFFELHVTRIVLELAGLLRKTKGRFYLTKKYQKIARETGVKGLYPVILRTYCSEFNWGYWDNYKNVSFIQQSFLFTLYLLKLHGDKMTFTSAYEDDFVRAFPMVIDEFEGSSYSTPEQDLRNCYYYRACKRFLVFLGLADIEVIKSGKLYEEKYKIQKTPLFDAVMHFNLKDQKPYKTINSNVHSDYLH